MVDIFDGIRTSGDNLDTSGFQKVRCIDMHTGGEPLRVILGGGPSLKSKTILKARDEMRKDHDAFRTALMWEPRGHTDMYGALIIPAERVDSAFGVLFLHNEGYSTMCGHATIALGRLAVELGWIEITGPRTEFRIDAPCGQLSCFVDTRNGEVLSSGFYNVPSFVAELGAEIQLEDGVTIAYDLAFGGAYYAFVNANQFEVPVTPENASFFATKGMEIKKAVASTSSHLDHPEHTALSFLYGTIFIEDSPRPGIHSRNVCMFADGEIDRSPTGSGVSARAAIHRARNTQMVAETVTIESIIGSTMDVTIDRELDYHGRNAIIPKVQGNAWVTGQHAFLLNPNDPLRDGFLLR